VLVPDWPGNGARWAERSPATVAGLTEALRQDLRAQGVALGSEPVGVLALSLGAMVSCDWAQRHPRELAAAVLVNTSLRGHSPFWQRLRPARYAGLLRRSMLPTAAEDWERHLLAITAPLHARSPGAAATLADWVRLRQSQPVSRANALRQLAAALRYRPPRRPRCRCCCCRARATAWSPRLQRGPGPRLGLPAAHPPRGRPRPAAGRAGLADRTGPALAARSTHRPVTFQFQDRNGQP
jgi:pimeloyl-ACP methyl ester carboxylesterase